MIPLYDLQKLKQIPYVTYGLIGANMLVFLLEMLLSPTGQFRFFLDFGVIPKEITSNFLSVNSLTLISSLFLHANWIHLASNLLVLLIFGDDIEDWLGRGLYFGFYILCGILGMLAQIIIYPNSDIPIIGASGAISGVLGAYAVVYAQTPIRCLSLRYFYTRRLEDIPAAWILIFWFAYQLIGAIINLGGFGLSVAYFAHLGGFGAGYIFARFYVDRYGKPVSVYSMGYGNPFRAWGNIMRSRTGASTSPRIIDFRQSTERSPQPNMRWQSDPDMAAQEMKDFEAELQSIREKMSQRPRPVTPSGGKSQIEFVGLSALDQRARAMKFFTEKKGETVEVETHNLGTYRGTVISLNSKQVMLRDDTGKNSWIPLEDISRVR